MINMDERRTHHTLAELLAILAYYKPSGCEWPMGLLHLRRQILYKTEGYQS